MSDAARFLAHWEVGEVTGAVVAIDVIRAFTTAAYAFAAGAKEIYLVTGLDEARAFKARYPGSLAMGEEGGMRAPGFDFSNSPVALSRADVSGRTIVQRTGAGTRGAVAAKSAQRLWCASLVVASATAHALRQSGLGAPTYVITGRFQDLPMHGEDDLFAARYIEALRAGQVADAAQVAHDVATSDEAKKTLSLPPEHCDPRDIEYATRVDAFSFAMEATRDARGLRLIAHEQPKLTG